MDDMKISLSVPATIYSFGETEKILSHNKYVTHCKLKIFYVGQTPDKRVFTKQFSDQLLQTLPGTPVVAYYDEEGDDFVGHNVVQYVFGYVPETATIGYQKEGDVTFAVTDVLLFTGRGDNIGEVAKKIIGKQHSLELDPESVEYTIVRANNKIQSMTFTKASFIGLSVLGDKEKPAFTGSSFFTDDGSELDTFVRSFKEFKREVEFYKSGGQEMNEDKNIPVVPEEAKDMEPQMVTPPMGDDKEGCEAVDDLNAPDETPEEMGKLPTEMLDPQALVPNVPVPEDPLTDPMVNPILDPIEREDYPKPEQIVLEPDPNRIEPSRAGGEIITPPMAGQEIEIENEPEEPEEEMEPEEPEAPEEEEEEDKEPEDMKAGEFPKEGTADVRKTKQEAWTPEEVAHATALNDAERQELNAYRKAAKFDLIDSYVDLSTSVKEKFKADHEKYTLDSLDKELAFELVKSQRQIKSNGVKVFSMTGLGFDASKPKTEAEKLKELVEKYKDK